jgi:predicted nucleotidyltransferase
MYLNNENKEEIKRQVIASLKSELEIQKIIIFGSYLNSDNPKDIDIAIIQDSEQPYLSLALKYRKLMRKLAKRIPLDVIPINSESPANWFLDEINSGELIYERRN